MLVLASSTILIVAGYFKVHDEVIVPPYPFIGPIRPRPYKVTFFAKFWRLELEMEFLVFVHIYYLEILLLQKNGSAVAVIFHILPVLFVKVITDT